MSKDKIERRDDFQLSEEQREMLEKRARDILEGKVKLLTWEEIKQRLRKHRAATQKKKQK